MATEAPAPLAWLQMSGREYHGIPVGQRSTRCRYIVAPYLGHWIVSLAREPVTLAASFANPFEAMAAADRYHAWRTSGQPVKAPFALEHWNGNADF